jgi:hypothetical protein
MAEQKSEDAYRITTSAGERDVATRAEAATAFREHFAKPEAGFIQVWHVATDGTNWAMKLWDFNP